MDDSALHTLDELTGLVEAALAVDYRGAPTGRVRDVPDQRAIRWYVTRGLVDRPAAARGRVALYNRRHLLQLVAIKRRQEQGRSLAEIQAELAGATDDTLAAIARLSPTPAEPAPAEPAPAEPAPAPTRPRFWTDRPTPTAAPAGRKRTSGPTASTHPHERDNSLVSGPAGPDHGRVHAPEVGVDARATNGHVAGAGVGLRGIRLAPGITLLVEDGAGAPADPKDILAAARPLLDLLAAGGHASHASEEE